MSTLFYSFPFNFPFTFHFGNTQTIVLSASVTFLIAFFTLVYIIESNTESEVSLEQEIADVNHPALRTTIENCIEYNFPIGFLKHDTKLKQTMFTEFHDILFQNGELYCSYKGVTTLVSNVIALENKIRNPHWLNNVYIEKEINKERKHILLKDYVALKYNISFQ